MSPLGPLPPEVYWRRRAAVIAAVVLAVVVLVWVVTAATGGSGPEATAQQGPLTPSSTPATTPAPATTTSATPTTTAAPTITVAPAAPTTSAPAAPPATTTAVPATTAAAEGTSAPVCVDTAIGVTAQVAAASYPVGALPVFRILVTNTGPTACTRDLDAALQSVVVLAADGTTRLWSSNDCYPEKSVDAPTLAPGETKTYSVKWAGTTSEPTCTADRTPVPAGTYQVVVALGSITSAPVPFILTPA